MGSDPAYDFMVSGNLLFFTTGKGVAGGKLWRSDGTSSGTYPLKGFRQGYSGPILHDLTPAANGIYFRANDGQHGAELWFSDGSVAGTRLVADLGPGADSSSPSFLEVAGERLFFSSYFALPAGSLWQTNGTSEGTRPLMKPQKLNGSSISLEWYERTAAGSGKKVFFRANDGRHGEELWVTNGTRVGTKMIRDIMSGEENSDPVTVTPFGKGVLFRARNKDHGWDVWFSDGSRKGTRPLTSNGGSEGLTDPFAVVGKTAYFEFDEAGEDGLLWQTDGSPEGTFPVTVADGLMLSPYHRSPMAQVGETLYLGADDGIHGAELWALIQGTPRLVKDLRPGASGSSLSLFTAVGRRLAFFVGSRSSRGSELWTSDGTEAGTVKVAEGFSEVSASTGLGDIHLFLADDKQHGNEWWRSDGTPEGTFILKDIAEGSGQRSLEYTSAMYAVGDDAMYFVADDGAAYGEELWKTDGTPEGTTIVADLKAGFGSSSPAELLFFNRRLFFAADDGVNGRNIWSTTGTAESCFMHAARNGTDADPLMITPLGDRLFFFARSVGKGIEPHALRPSPENAR
ncbi:ELWxxDGT repeat protein [Luteolibacter luteus]|uniref:ELWxxDGT repeat protein n=1 Tax=Luteolibacter luteus TaxID=2728835 RepID=UPI001F0EFDDD|nr:ELWxxDGT repeat protein [Luteolibacter luteus]